MNKLVVEYTADKEISNKLINAIMTVIESEKAAVNNISNINNRDIEIPIFMKKSEGSI